MGWFPLVLSVSVVFCAVLPAFCGERSLFYTYTALSQPLKLPGIYEFTALEILDDQVIEYYDSNTQVKVPKQDWMKEKMPRDYWEKETQTCKSKEQWFKVNMEILMERMRHNKTELHVLQWRHGCVIKNGAGHDVTFLRGINEYSYDGTVSLSFNERDSRWIIQAAEPTKSSLEEYEECVDRLTKFMDYGQEELKKHSPPDVYLFAKKSASDPEKLTLTCMATGFYPKDIEMNFRKYRTTLPDHLLTSSGVRANGDGTYQLRKSVEITAEDKALYKCYVNHITLNKPIIIDHEEDIPCLDCTKLKVQSGIIRGAVGALVVLVLVAVLLFILKKKRVIRWGSSRSSTVSTVSELTEVMLPSVRPDVKDPNSDNSSGVSSDGSRSSIENPPMMSQSTPGNSSGVSSDGSQSSIEEKVPMMSQSTPGDAV